MKQPPYGRMRELEQRVELAYPEVLRARAQWTPANEDDIALSLSLDNGRTIVVGASQVCP